MFTTPSVWCKHRQTTDRHTDRHSDRQTDTHTHTTNKAQNHPTFSRTAQSVPGATAKISRPAMTKPSFKWASSVPLMSRTDTAWSQKASATAFAPWWLVRFPTPTKISLPAPSESMILQVNQSSLPLIIIIIAFKGAIPSMRDFLQSPHSAVNCLQHVRSSGLGAIVCKSRATHRALITFKCHVTCHLVRRDSSAIQFDRVEMAFIWTLFYWLNH